MSPAREAPRPAARAIVLKDGKILSMKRNKHGKRYVVLIGGRLEPGETAEEAVLREVLEETGVAVKNPVLVFIENDTELYGTQYIFLCEYVSGEPALSPDSEEYALNSQGQDTYSPVWYGLDELANNEIPFRSDKLRSEILAAIETGFPKTPKNWTP